MVEAPVMANVQGLVRAAYKHLSHAQFVLFRARKDAEVADLRRWLGELSITSGAEKHEARSLNLAFTAPGLERFGAVEKDLLTFPEAFTQGMTGLHRQRILGDHTESAPSHWAWGKPDQVLHGVLLCYAKDPDELAGLVARVVTPPIEDVQVLPTFTLDDRREHFGFRDGMGQPEYRGVHPHTPFRRPIATGELLLGYENEYGELPRSPRLGGADLGRDGTYLVLRQLQQHVGRFWRFVREQSDRLHLARRFPGAEDPVILLASKMVGRWPGGAPMAMSPDRDDRSLQDADDFDYSGDEDGARCPFGSHVRRANPRNWFLGSDPAESLEVASRHRILRRGRSYGPPLVRDIRDTRALSRTPDDNVPRGLLFACLNANLERHFEVVQHNWLNNPKFGGLHGGADPVVGDHDPETKARDLPSEFLIPASPVRCRVRGLERFVTVRGGAYFFMPSLAAISMLAKR